MALFGCALGNFFTLVYFSSQAEQLGFMELLINIDIAAIPSVMTSTFDGMDILFYAIAIYEGFKLSFRQVTEEDFETSMNQAA